MNIVFRVDASAAMGTGHLMRCLTLAEHLRECGARISFITREHPGNLIAEISRRVFPVTVLPPPEEFAESAVSDYRRWLGISQEEDAAQTIRSLRHERPDLVIVDHYGLDVVWERELRTVARAVMVIDDLANRRHDCDVLLDQNYAIGAEQRYVGLVPDGCRVLVGPRYALVSPEYLEARGRTLRDGEVHSVVVFFGGADPHNLTIRSLEALSNPKLQQLEVDVVIGAASPTREEVIERAASRPNTRLHSRLPTLVHLMSKADIAVGGGGATTWERMCLGLPSVVVCVAENQRAACEALSQDDLIEFAGDVESAQASTLGNILVRFCAARDRRKAMSKAGRALVDGRGALRVTEVLIPTPAKELRATPIPLPDDTAKSGAISLGISARRLAVSEIHVTRAGEEAVLRHLSDPIFDGREWFAQIVAMTYQALYDSTPRRFGSPTPRGVFLRLEKPLNAIDHYGGASETTLRPYRVAVLSDQDSWINEYLPNVIVDWLNVGRRIQWCHDPQDLLCGDFCFYLSCSAIIPLGILKRFRHNLVVHESDLPTGRGWSPLTWQVLEGKSRIPVTLFEAAAKVDSGSIYAQTFAEFEGNELIDELRAGQMRATRALCDQFLDNYPGIVEHATQQNGEPTYYPRRAAEDSRLDTSRPLSEQFNLLRVVDNQRYPAWFDYAGRRYVLAVTTAEDNQ